MPLALRNLVDGNDVGMTQARQSLRLGTKTLEVVWRGKLAVKNHLHRHGSLKAGLSRPINHAHRATRNFFEQFVITDPTGAGLRRDFSIGGFSHVGQRIKQHVSALFEKALHAQAVWSIPGQRAAAHGTFLGCVHHGFHTVPNLSHAKIEESLQESAERRDLPDGRWLMSSEVQSAKSASRERSSSAKSSGLATVRRISSCNSSR